MRIRTRQDLEEMVVSTIEKEKQDKPPKDAELVIALHTVTLPRKGSFDYFRGRIQSYQDFCVDGSPEPSQMFAVCWIIAFCRLYSAEYIEITRWD